MKLFIFRFSRYFWGHLVLFVSVIFCRWFLNCFKAFQSNIDGVNILRKNRFFSYTVSASVNRFNCISKFLWFLYIWYLVFFYFSNLFNNRFALQCSMFKNASSLPSIEYKTNEWLIYFDINENDILSIIINLNVSKPHEWDKILISMIKHS